MVKVFSWIKDYNLFRKIFEVQKLIKDEINIEEQNLKSFINKNTEVLEVFSSQAED